MSTYNWQREQTSEEQEYKHSDLRQTIGQQACLTKSERQQLLEEWNKTEVPYPQEQTLAELFAQQARAHPDAIAVSSAQGQMSYGELDRRSNQLAHYLQSLGVGPEALVGICLERSLELMIGLLGILKAGGGYVPLDPTYPQERLNLMITDTQTSVVLTRQGFVEHLPPFQGKTICLDRVWKVVTCLPTDKFTVQTVAHNVAYVIYTSGSTGRAKGVIISHQAVARLIFPQTFTSIGLGDRVGYTSNVTFDVTTFEIWGALLHGGCVICVDHEILLTPVRLAHFLHEQAINAIFVTTALFHLLARERPGIFAGIREVLIGGEAAEPHWVRQVLADGAPERLVNGYGPTECTAFATWYLMNNVPDQATTMPIGTPLANTQVYVLDAFLQPVPVGVVGELYLGGPGLARGYLNRPDITAERFLPHPFSSQPGTRLYRTGDLARWSEHEPGVLEFMGRIDQQVKLRGFRIEPGEIESVLRSQPEVQEAVVEMREVVPGEKSLVAYVVPAAFTKGLEVQLEEHLTFPISTQDSFLPTELFHYTNNPLQGKIGQTLLPHLRMSLMTYLPEYMVPAFFVLLDTLPLNANGKLDRRALPLPERRQMASADAATALRTSLEEQVTRIWCEVLRIEQLGVNENFFELGGHSLLAIQIISRVREAFHVDIPLHVFFESHTIRGLAQAIEAASLQVQIKMPSLERLPRPALLPVSPTQQYFWFLDQLEPDNPMHIVPLLIRVSGPLEVELLEKSIQAVVQRHETLRTTFHLKQGQIVQVIQDTFHVPLTVTHFESYPELEREEEMQHFLQQQLTQRLNITRGPLLRVSLLCLEEQNHLLLIVMHHIISDGQSSSIFFRDVIMHYQALQEGSHISLPSLPVQYADYILWHNQWFEGETKQKQIDYWVRQLADAPVPLPLSTNMSQPSAQSYQGSAYSISLSESLSDALRRLSQQENVTVFTTLLTGFSAVLAAITGRDDFVLGTTVARRTRSEIENLIGPFAEALVLRIGLAELTTWRELLQQVHRITLEAYDNQDLTYIELQRALGSGRKISAPFQVLFAMYDVAVDSYVLGDTSIDNSEIMYTASIDLEVHVEDLKEMKVSFSYKKHLFDIETIHRLAREYEKLLELFVSDVDGHFLAR